MRREKSRAIIIPFIGGKDVMPITGYFGPYPHDYEGFPNYFTEDIFQKIADAGINLMVYSAADYHTQPEFVEMNLMFGEKYGVGVFVTDNSIVEGDGAQTITAEVAIKKMELFKDRKAFCGMYVVDEPTATYYCDTNGSRLISKYEKASKVLQQDLNQLCYINLLPVINLETETRVNYERYVNEFCDTLQPKVVLWDMYPFDKNREGKMEVYFYNMDVIRKAADDRNLPFWAFIQAGSQWNDNWNEFETTTPYFPDEEQFNWNVNTSLAFGAQGIQYFPLVQPYQFTITKEGDYECNGIIGAMGNKTQWYYYAQTVNRHIKAIDKVLMNSTHKGVIASGEQAKRDLEFTTCVIESESFNELQSVSGNALVGCFNYQGKTALYVVNHSFEHVQNIKLEFEGVQNLQVIQKAKEADVSTSELILDMAAGEGILIVIQQSRRRN